MRTAKQKFNQANGALRGFEMHGNFLESETLLSIAQSDNFQRQSSQYCNEHMRAWRDLWWELDNKRHRYLNKNNKGKLKELYDQWLEKTLSYFGYQDFQITTADFDELGKVCFYVSQQENTHSVAVFICNDSNAYSVFERGHVLTNLEGQSFFEDKVKESWTLAEQLEKTIKKAGIGEAVLFMPDKIYYFRADSQLSNECLEVDLLQLMKADSEDALALATHLLRADFFKYHLQQSEDKEDTGSVKLTESANLFTDNLKRSREITEELHRQMTLALELLINERLNIDQELADRVQDKSKNQKIADALFNDALFVLYRILFILFAEAKKFLPIDNKQYASFYSIDHFIDWAENYLKHEKRGNTDPEGTYLWHALQALFTLMNTGIELQGGELVNAYNGELFEASKTPNFATEPCLRDAALSRIIIALTKVNGDVTGQRWNFANLGVEQIGAVYEALLSQRPRILRTEHVWVNAHGGGVALVSKKFAANMQLEPCLNMSQCLTQKKKMQKNKTLENFVQQQRPAFKPRKGKFVLDANGGTQKSTASFYTPPQLTKFLVEQTLQPLVVGKSYTEILALNVIEPAVGCGSFLIAAVRYLAQALLKAKQREQHLDLRGKKEVNHEDLQKCKREICEHCLHGVDVNSRAVNLAIVSLHLECIIKGKKLPALDRQIKHGNSLLHANFHSDTLFDLPIEHLKLDKKIITAYDEQCLAYGKEAHGQELYEIFKQRRAELKKEHKHIGTEARQQFVDKMQTKVKAMLAELQNNDKRANIYQRLKQLGDLWVALWFWPFNKYHLFPSHADFQSICEHLLFNDTALDERQQKILNISAKLADKHNFFHWQLEFPHIVNAKCGFDALLCNPPWGVVGVKDKTIYPSFDPQFMNTKEAHKEKRKQQLYHYRPKAAHKWYRETHFASTFSQFYSCADITAVVPQGQLDTCVLFTLLSGNLIAKGGRNGLLLSKSAIYTNKATKNLREYLFAEWGLEYGYAFVNTLGIFPIAGLAEFAILIGENTKSCTPSFVNGIVDLNSLSQDLSTEAVAITMQEITRYFSKDNGSIPSLSSQKLKEIIIALQTACGEVLYLDQLDTVKSIQSGIHIKNGPRLGISQYTEKIPQHELSTAKWIPLYKGKNFHYLHIRDDIAFEQYMRYAHKPAKINLNDNTFVWRYISGSSISRTLICSILPSGVWFDNSVYGIQFNNEKAIYQLATLWSTMTVDVCVRLNGGMNVTLGNVSTIPIPSYDSVALQKAVHIYRKNFGSNEQKIMRARANIDALVWLHYGGGKPPLDCEGLAWLMETQFPLVAKNEPEYLQLVLEAYDYYSKDKKYLRITGEAFRKKGCKKAA